MTTPEPIPGGGAPHPANDPTAGPRPVYAEPDYRYEWDEDGKPYDPSTGWDLAFGCRISFGPMDGVLRASVNMSDHELKAGSAVRKVTPEQVRAHANHLLTLLAELEAGGPIATEPVEKVMNDLMFQRDTARADADTMAHLFEGYAENYLGLPDTTPVAEVHEHVLAALRELEQWRSGSRITQESSDQQDRAMRAEHQLAEVNLELDEVRAELALVVRQRDKARTKAAAASGRAVDLAGRLDRIRQALDPTPADQLTPGRRVRIGGCVGTVERQPRRVRVRLDGAPPAVFDARFVHPFTDAEDAAERVVDLDPPPAGLVERVQHAVTEETSRG